MLPGDVESRSLLTELGFAKAYLPHPAVLFLEWEAGPNSSLRLKSHELFLKTGAGRQQLGADGRRRLAQLTQQLGFGLGLKEYE